VAPVSEHVENDQPQYQKFKLDDTFARLDQLDEDLAYWQDLQRQSQDLKKSNAKDEETQN
jgi:hypothetical protein